MPSLVAPIELFLALFALYSPLAAVSSYFPMVNGLSAGDRKKLAIGLFFYVSVFVLTALWVGEPLLKLLGVTTAALTVTGGIALMYAAIPLMRGTGDPPAPSTEAHAGAEAERIRKDQPSKSWKSMLFMPVTFPLTVGGTTVAIIVSFRSLAANIADVIALSVALVVYAAITGITVYTSGAVERRASLGTKIFLERIAGILLVAIASMLLFGGGTRMVHETLGTVKSEAAEKSQETQGKAKAAAAEKSQEAQGKAKAAAAEKSQEAQGKVKAAAAGHVEKSRAPERSGATATTP
jgi:multiple antibiotic resistance protein